MKSEKVLLEMKSGDSDQTEEFPLTWIGHNRFMINSRDMINQLQKAIERFTKRNRDVDDRGYEKMIKERQDVIRKLNIEVQKSNIFDHHHMPGCGACNPNFHHTMPAPIVVEKPVMMEPPRTIIHDPVYMHHQLPANRFGHGYSDFHDQYAQPFHSSIHPYHNRSYLDESRIDRFPMYTGSHMGDSPNRFPIDYRNHVVPIDQ